MKKLLSLFALSLCFVFASMSANAQVDVSTGGPATTYANLKLAFDAINAGTHTGVILIEITGVGTYTDPAAPAVLNSSGAGSASYTSVLIRPSVDAVTISATTLGGRGVIELNGADNVTIDGDNPNTAGINRNLTIQNLASSTTTYTSCVRIANSAAVTSSDANTVKNCILTGSATGRMISTATSTTGSENTTFGIYVGGNGGATATTAPTAIASVTTNTAPSGTTVNGFTVNNNSINACARALVFNGAATTVSNGVTVTSNTVGDQGAPSPADPPYTSPTTTVYTKGLWIAGTSSITITGNAIKNVMSYVATTTTAIELSSAIGAAVTISNNNIQNTTVNATSSPAVGILVSSASTTYTISSNTILNTQSRGGSSGTAGMNIGGTATSGTIELNVIEKVINRSTSTFGASGLILSTTTGVTVKNNRISNILMDMTGGAAFSTTFGVHGIKVSGTSHKIYHNSVNLYGTLLGTGATSILTSCFAILGTGNTGMDVRNNIFANNITGGTTSIAHVSIYLPPSGTASMNLTLNNNAYYAGSASGSTGAAHVGTTYTNPPVGPATYAGLYSVSAFDPNSTSGISNLRSYTSTLGLTANDNSAFASSLAVPFVTSTDLHIPAGTGPTKLESGGASVGVVTDIDNDVRPGPAGSIYGGATAPDMGADEFDGRPGSAPADPNNVGAISADFNLLKVYSVGKGYDFKARVKNFAANTQTVIPVYYKVNGGTPVGPVNTVGPIPKDSTEQVTFSGGNAFIPTTSGNNVIKIWTALGTDTLRSDDTTTLTIFVGDKIAAFPHLQNFTNPAGWTVVVENVVGTTALWGLGICTNPDGKVSDTAATSNCYTGSALRREILRSPEIDLSTLTNPVLNFYTAYKSYTGGEDDTMQVVVSTDAGLTWFSATTVFDKSDLSVPSLATRPGATSSFFPDSSKQWRHEVIDLSNVAGQSNVVIGFRSKSDFGNRQWVDNVIISNNASLCNSTVTTPGVYSCNSLVSLNFSTVGLKPSIFVPTDSSPKIINEEEKDSRIIGTFASAAGNVVVSNTQNDNPTGGVAAVQQYNVNGNNGAGIAVNTTSTNQNGGIYTPTSVVSDKYFTVTYTGNDKAGFATYSISIDVSSYGGAISPNDAYIMKRTDISGKWVCVNTTASGSILTASGLTTFSDFSVGTTPITLTLKTRLEAIQLLRKDSITVNVRSNTAPYPIVETKKVVYDSLTGISTATLSNVVNGTSYFLQIAHRNSISTWSAAAVTVSGGALNYDFTTSVNQAYGSNQVLVSGVASFYTGDVNQDGTADGTDASLIDNDAFNFVSGDYVITDLNYDGTVDASDAAFIDNNAANFVGEVKPPGALNPNNSKNLERASSTNGNR